MKNKFSTKWISSKRPAKQRKYRHQAPLHVKQKFMSVHLSPELRKKYSRRSFPVVKGDKVKVLRGQHKGRENKVERADHKKLQVYITGIERSKKDGSKSIQPLKPSNIMITELHLEDKKRKASLEKKPTPKSTAKKVNKAENKAEKKTSPANTQKQKSPEGQ